GAEKSRKDQELIAKLIDIRSREQDDLGGSAADAAYSTAFRDAGIDIDGPGGRAAASTIIARPEGVRLALAAGLDDWAAIRRVARATDVTSYDRLVEAARAADPDAKRDKLRTLLQKPDRKAQLELLRDLAREAEVETWPVQSL